MRFNEFNEGIDPGAKAAIKGMRQLSGDQYYGLYKTMKDVAGHDGEKQTSPEGATDHEVSDQPFAYAYTDAEKKMIKGVDPKAKQITSDKSEELDESHLDEFQLNPTGVLASLIRWAVNNPVLITAVGAAGLATASAATAGLALGPIMTLVSTGQAGLGLLTLDKLMNMIQTNPSQAEGYIKKYIYKYIGDESDVQEFEKLHAQTAYKGETEFRWRAEVWPVTIDKNESERWLEKNDKYWLDNYNKEQADKEQADKEQATAQQNKPPTTPAPPSLQDFASTVPPYTPPTRPTESYDHRDDERHDLDVPRPLIYGLKINGKIWKKAGNTVTFFTKERALAAKKSMLNTRPELEITLIERPRD